MSKHAKLVKLGQLVNGGTSYYDGASYDPVRDWGKMPVSTHEDLLFSAFPRQVAIARLRREIRNSPFLAGLVNRFPMAIGHTSLRSRTSDKKFNAQKNLFWYRYSKRVEITGMSLATVEDIVWRELLVAGEAFIVFLNSGRIELIPSEFCGSTLDAKPGELNGILYNADNVPTGYRFGRMGKDGQIDYKNSTVVDARNVIHIFRRDRVCMGRGLPWLLPSMAYARDLWEMTRKKFKQIKDANSLFAFLKKEGAQKWLNGLQLPPDSQIDGTTKESEDDAADKTDTKRDPQIELKEGVLLAGEPGTELQLLSGDYHVTDHKEISVYALHAISAPLGIPVEIWFSGLGDVSFSGFKGIGTNWDDQRREYCLWAEGVWLDKLHLWRMEYAVIAGELPANPDKDDDLIAWGWGPTPVLDIEREAKARAALIEAGLSSLVEEWERAGKFADEELWLRRSHYIELLVASGRLEESADHSKVEVPIEFLLYNHVPSASEQMRAFVDTYGIAVRAGLVTPNLEDEIYFRKLAGLPAPSEAVIKDWETNPTRKPITINNDPVVTGVDQTEQAEMSKGIGPVRGAMARLNALLAERAALEQTQRPPLVEAA